MWHLMNIIVVGNDSTVNVLSTWEWVLLIKLNWTFTHTSWWQRLVRLHAYGCIFHAFFRKTKVAGSYILNSSFFY